MNLKTKRRIHQVDGEHLKISLSDDCDGIISQSRRSMNARRSFTPPDNVWTITMCVRSECLQIFSCWCSALSRDFSFVSKMLRQPNRRQNSISSFPLKTHKEFHFSKLVKDYRRTNWCRETFLWIFIVRWRVECEKICWKMKLKKLSVRKKSVSPELDTLDDFNDDDLCSNGLLSAKFEWICSLIVFFSTWRWQTEFSSSTQHCKRSWTSSNASLIVSVLSLEDDYSLGTARHEAFQTRHTETREKLHLLSDCDVRWPTCERDHQ